jgi:class 3 adenylate cyclase
MNDYLNALFESRIGGWVIIAILVAVLLLFTSAAYGQVRTGNVVGVEAAILCQDIEAAKYLADQVEDGNVEEVGRAFIQMRVCGIAAGSMQVESFIYEGKRFNVFGVAASGHLYYWVTVMKPQYD